MNPQTMTNRTVSTLATAIFAALLCGVSATAAGAATLTVNSTGDAGDGACDATECTLREAIAAANASAEDDVIEFGPAFTAGPQTVVLALGQLEVTGGGALTINGPAGANRVSVSGNGQSRVLRVGGGANLTLNNLTITGGKMTGPAPYWGGGVLNDGGTLTITGSTVSGNSVVGSRGANAWGGGIHNAPNSTLTITGSTVSGNSVVSSGTGSVRGGGIFNISTITTASSTLTITGSTVSGNSAIGSDASALVRGGGISNAGSAATATITNCTISGNSLTGHNSGSGGGGIENLGGSLTITSSTVTDNSANSDRNINGPFGGGLYLGSGGFNAANVIIAGNTVSGHSSLEPDVYGTLNSLGHNLIGNTGFLFNITGDTATNIINQPALLGPLADNGGPTLTHALLPGSPALDAGGDALALDPDGNPLRTDQRGAGYARVAGAHVDIGAVEATAFDATPPVITPHVSGTLGNDGWYTSDVQVTWVINDPESPTYGLEGCGPQNVTADSEGVTFTCSASSAGRSDTQSVTVKRDATAPQITYDSRTPAANGAGWNKTDVMLKWNCSDSLSGASSPSVTQTVTTEGQNQSALGVCADNAGNTASDMQSGVSIDKTPPSVTFASRTAPNAAGWNNTDVALSWNCADALSGAVASSVGQALSSEGANLSATGVCSDAAGNTASDTQEGIKIDRTKPTLSPSVSPNPVPLGGTATATPNASDSLSDVASQSCGTVDTSSVGAKSITCTAADAAGNSATASASYTVWYNFLGFFQPVENLPALNVVSAGQAVPVKFSLGGYQGLAVFAPGYPASGAVACDANEPGNEIVETVAAGGSSLSYSAATDQYSYVWKTDKAWKGTCRILIVKLKDGTDHYAKFRFK